MRSGNSLAAFLIGAFLAAPALCEEAAGRVLLVVQSAPLAGWRYYSGPELWSELRVGDALELAREPENPHDPNAIAVSWRGRKLGYLPRRENAALAWGLDRGERLRARIRRLGGSPNRTRRLEVEVFVE